MRALQQEVAQAERHLESLAVMAVVRVADEARKAVAPAARDVERAVALTTERLRGAGRTVWTWYGGLLALAMLVCVVAWAVLGYYKHQLSLANDELAHYEQVIPVVKAFHASDAVLCEERLCVNVDPTPLEQGDRRQYQQARPRP